MAEPLKRERCPLCGSDLLKEKSGTYVFDWSHHPGTSAFDNATWQWCAYCGNDILSHELIARIEDEWRKLRMRRHRGNTMQKLDLYKSSSQSEDGR